MITFRCEHCGKSLEVQSAREKTVRCPLCRRRAIVPQGLSELPRPMIPFQEAPGASEAEAMPPRPAEMTAEEAPASHSRLEVVLASMMPWLASILLHAGLLTILMFVVALASSPTAPSQAVAVEVFPPDPNFSPGAPDEKPGPDWLEAPDAKTSREDLRLPWLEGLDPNLLPGPKGPDPYTGLLGPAGPLPPGPHVGLDPEDENGTASEGWPGTGAGTDTPEAYSSGESVKGGGGRRGDFGMARGGGTAFSSFYGAGGGGGGGRWVTPPRGNAYNVIFVLDASGSVLQDFDDIRQELKSSIYRMNKLQTFHVMFFSGDAVKEAPARRLVTADPENKREIQKFVNSTIAQGYGSSPIPALIAAFKAFRNGANLKGQVLYILTDGEFNTSNFGYTSGGKELTGAEAVIAWLRDNNKDKFVHVYPIVLGPPPSPEVKEAMKTIASENGGEYKYVEPRR